MNKLAVSAVALVAIAFAACYAERNSGVGATSPPLDQPAKDVPPATAGTLAPATSASVAGTWNGYGTARFGMSPDDVKSTWGSALDGAPDADSTCFYLIPHQRDGRGSPALMIENGKFVRYDVVMIADVAPGGGQVGMSAGDIRTAYGVRVETQPHKYIDGANNLRVKSAAGRSALVFETDEAGKVTAWRVGVPPQVDYVEGCS